MLTIEKLTSGYGKLTILRDLTLEIDSESVGLFGPNGAGKTTLINAILGINPAWSGKIIFHGEDITGLPTHEVARRGIALVPQERELFPTLSVTENLELGAAFIPHARDDWESTLTEVHDLFPILKERGKQPAGTMSGGQQRMLAIGRALMARPKLLVLDEPSLGLQPSIVNELFTILQEMKNKVDVLVTEQNVRESLRAIDRGYVLENGMIAMDGSADSLAGDPHVMEAYLGI